MEADHAVPITFKEYHSIRVKGRRTKGQMSANQDGEWIVLEKVHGSNFSFICNGKEIRGARRGDILDNVETFYNWQGLRDKYSEGIFKLFNHLKTDPEITKNGTHKLGFITIYGEIFGGVYPHDEVTDLGILHVQKGVYYSNTIDFYAFDILITILDSDGKQSTFWANYNEVMKWFAQFGFFYAKPLLTGSLEDCMKFKVAIATTIPKLLDLPPLPKNIMEGVVVKSTEIFVQTDCNTRSIFKVKNPNFTEINPVYRDSIYETKKKQKTNAVDTIYDEIERYINENRMDNVKSKLTQDELNLENINFIVTKFCEDIFKDFSSGNGDESHAELWAFVAEDETVITRVKTSTKSKVSIFVREWLTKNIPNKM